MGDLRYSPLWESQVGNGCATTLISPHLWDPEAAGVLFRTPCNRHSTALLQQIHLTVLYCSPVVMYPPPALAQALGNSGKRRSDRVPVLGQGGACARRTLVPKEHMALEHNVRANFSKFWRSLLPIRGIRSCGIEALSNLVPHHKYNCTCLPLGAGFEAGLASGFGMGLGFLFLGTKLSSTISLVK